jgi:fibronectin type 3 domain-containing protein
MKFSKFIFILLAAIVCAVPLWAQPFQVSFATIDAIGDLAPLDSICGSTLHPIADGTTVELIWDRDPAGPSANDTLAPLCNNEPDCDNGTGPSGTVNYNVWTFNGEEQIGDPSGRGNFWSPYIMPYAANPSPSRFYLRVCLDPPGQTPHRYISRSVTLGSGIQDILFGAVDWTCVDSSCGSCPVPPAPTGFTAADSLATNGVVLTWIYGEVPLVDGFQIFRDGALLTTVGPTIRTYTDNTAVAGNRYLYSIKAHNSCGRVSTEQTDYGSVFPSPPVPTNVIASDGDFCDSVRVQWNYTTASGVDSFIIKRSGVRVGAVLASGSPRQMTFFHVTSLSDVAPYTVVAWNHIGLQGVASAPDNGNALQRPVTVTGINATQGLCDSTVITWTSQPLATSYYVHRARNDGTGDTTFTAVTQAPYRVVDRTAIIGDTYRYWVLAGNTCGTGPAAAFVTGFRNGSPAVPGSFNATDSTGTFCDRVRCTWTDVATDTVYYVYRQLSTGGTIDSFRVATNSTQYDDMTALPTATYNYWIKGRNGCGFGTASAQNSGSVKRATSQVTGVSATDATLCLSVTITWANVANEDSFVVFRDAARIGVVAANVLTFDDITATPGTVYTYTVQAKNTCGNALVSAGDPGSRKTVPGQVTGLTASTTSCTSVDLAWNTLANTDSFEIYRAPGTFLIRVPVATLSYSDATAPSGASSYYILPKNSCGAGTQSSTVAGNRLPPLDAVTGLTATLINCQTVHIEWGTSQTADSFQIRRNGSRIASVGTSVRTYNDSTGNPDETYTYTVVAYNLCGAGAVANAVNGLKPGAVTATGLTATTNSCVFVALNWTNPTGEDSIVIKRDGTRLAKVLADVTSYNDSTAVPGTLYQYTIAAYNLCGAGPESAQVPGSKVVLPSVPANLTATVNVCTEITLGWDVSTGDVLNYEVFRNATSLGTVTTNAYHDLTATPGVVYAYTVKANSTNCGPSLASASANGYQPALATVPTSVAATTTRCDSVVITWASSTGHITGYEVYADNTLLTTVDSTILRYAYLPTVGSYSYTVKAYSTECGASAASTPAAGALLAYPTSASALTATTDRCDAVNLSWTAGTGDIAHYIINRDGNPVGTSTTTTYVDNVGDLNSHQYTVVSHSIHCTDPAASNEVTGQKLPSPTAPTNVAADTTRCDSVVVTWAAATGTFDNYILFRDHVQHAIIPAGTLRFGEAPTSGVNYRYTVATEDDICGRSDTLIGSNGRRQADATVPANLTATGNCDGVMVRWDASIGGLDHYILYRENAFLTTIQPPDTFYNDISAVRGETYSYKVSATSLGCGETAPSNSASGMRLPLLTAVTIAEVSQIRCDGIYVEWASLVGAAKYFIYRDDVLLDSVDAALRNDSYLDETALPRSVHMYKVAASNACGIGDQSTAVEGHRNDVPDVPATLTASDNSCTAIELTWTATTNTHNYLIIRDGTDLVTVDSTILAYSDTSAVAGTHSYEVKSVNACGASAASTAQNGYRIPGVGWVNGTAITQNLCERIIFSWADLPNESGYMVYRSDTLIATVDSNVTSYTDTLMSPGSHNYKVKAFNVCGEGPFHEENSGISHTIPPRVSSAVASTDSCSSILVHWDSVPTADYYLIFRNSVRIDSVGSLVDSLWDLSLTPGEYLYLIQTGNFCGRGLMSDQINGRVADVPPLPANFAASSNSCLAITLTWDFVPAALHYDLYRAGALIGTVPRDTLHFADTTATPGLHEYTIRSTNICGISPAMETPVSGERHGVPLGEPVVSAPDTACNHSVILHWSLVDDATDVVIYRDDVAIDSVGIAAESYVDNVPSAGMHRYMIQSRNACGRGPAPVLFRDVMFLPVAGQPLTLAATQDSCLTVTIQWDNVVDESGYRIVRGVADTVGSVGMDDTVFVDSPATPGLYTYRVVAFNACGLGPISGPVSGRRRGAPSQVAGVTASTTHCDNIVVDWPAATDAEYYRILRGGIVIDSVLAAVLTYTDIPGPGSHDYAIQACNVCGCADPSAIVAGIRITIPGTVSNFTASINTCDGVNLNWTDLTEATYYILHRDGTFMANISPDSTHYLDATAANNQNYTYALFAHDTCGTSLDSVTATGHRMLAAQDPIAGTASTNLCSFIHVTWTSGGGDVDQFYVIRDTTTRVGIVSGAVLSFDDAATGTHHYGIVAVSNECGLSDTSHAVLTGIGHSTPVMPTAVTVETSNCDSISLHWTAGVGGETEGYIIYRDGNPVAIDSVTGQVRFGDYNVPDLQNHSYTIRGYNSFCPPSEATGAVVGHLTPLATMTYTIPGDTIPVNGGLVLNYTYCNTNIDSVSYWLSRNNSATYTYLRGTRPVVAIDTVIMPNPTDNNCRVKARIHRGTRVDSIVTTPFRIGFPDAISDPSLEIPKDFFLDQNYPNPFNPSTVIRFGVPREANITIAVYDIMGRQVAVISDGRMQPGVHAIVWDCSSCPSGMYIVRFQTDDRTMMRKMLLMK